MGLIDQVTTFSTQVSQLVAENQHLRVKSDSDDETMRLLKVQYDTLAASVDITTRRHEAELHAMRTERDQAQRAFKEIDTLLLQAADIIMQALRARKGDETPEVIADRPVGHADHPALPPNVMEFDDGLRDLVRRLPQREPIGRMGV